ncbi:MAG: hypothetical protein DRI75_06150 [Bacteroidetes bacterium]|nr:MAG: hypothetical protein DRI75_06150 [Bacteroidota bacterium]
METKITACKNCEQEHEVGFGFCPHCGQKTNEDLTVGVLFYNTISNYFSFDARFFKSFIPLMFKPGILAKRFIQGKRLLYLHPAQMYLFISVVFFFLYSFKVREASQSVDKALQEINIKSNDSTSILTNPVVFDSLAIKKLSESLKEKQIITGMNDEDLQKLDSLINNSANQDEINKSLSFDFSQKKVDSLIASGASDEVILKEIGMSDDAGYFAKKFYSQILKFYKSRDGGSILQSFYDTIPLALFILLPIFAFLLKLLFYRKGPFSHHLVFSFYFFSFLFTVFAIILGVNYIWEVPDSIDTLLILSTFFYLFFAIKRFYGQGWFLSFFKTCVTTFVYLIFVAPIAFVFILGIAFLFY